MRARAIALLLGLAAVAALSACGSQGAATTEATSGATGAAAAHRIKEAAKAGGPDANVGESACQARLGDFVHSLDVLRRRLVVGLTYEQYVSEIEAIRSAYESVPVAKLDLGCLSAVGGPAESSFNVYIDAGNDWGHCVGTPGCSAATVEPDLQRKWRIGAKALAEAQAALAS